MRITNHFSGHLPFIFQTAIAELIVSGTCGFHISEGRNGIEVIEQGKSMDGVSAKRHLRQHVFRDHSEFICHQKI
jgi:Cu/Zn superoxide dismutase